MSLYNLTYKPFGSSAILIEWPAEINEKILLDVLIFKDLVLKKSTKQLVDIIHTYNSLTIIYDSVIEINDDVVLGLKSLYKNLNRQKKLTPKLWEIPVCYDKKFGLDLKEISLKNNLRQKDIIEEHSSQIYTVYFIGFLPGFLYLGGLVSKLHFPRKANPRLRIKRGAVGIGGSQTGIYPQESAGGWNIIGNSPINFFDCNKSKPCFARAGDKIKFLPIDVGTHEKISDLITQKQYTISALNYLEK